MNTAPATTNQPRQVNSLINPGFWESRELSAAESGLDAQTFEQTIDAWLAKPGNDLPEGGRELMVERLTDVHVIDDLTLQFVHREVAHELGGVKDDADFRTLHAVAAASAEILQETGNTSLASSLKEAVDRIALVNILDTDSATTASINDPRVQAGELFDFLVEDDGTVFERYHDGSRAPMFPQRGRFQTSRPLTDDEREHFLNLANHGWAAELHAVDGDVVFEKSDSPTSLIVTFPPVLKADNVDEYLGWLRAYVSEGTRERKSDKVAPAGSRRFSGIEKPPVFEFFFEAD
ncbi:hypothetical protein [Leifsonia sp. Leaf264]|uniref:hypothetical protein n=1 Tax=Leifsonia sp. Leaf264 TaxID=1736314 RepID=UPI0006F6134E|nr:hypothetical protein [Leifsonia sp. Leaf264]KQO98854.1 hypothetical protein ASF30_12390 [Leifsonia sp. Leaf264]